MEATVPANYSDVSGLCERYGGEMIGAGSDLDTLVLNYVRGSREGGGKHTSQPSKQSFVFRKSTCPRSVGLRATAFTSTRT